MPAMTAATAVRVVHVFIVWLLVGVTPALRQSEQRKERDRVPGTRMVLEKILNTVTKRQRPGLLPAAGTRIIATERLRLNDSDNLVRARINDYNLITDQDVIISTPFRIDHDHFLRERVQSHVGRDAGSDAD